MRIPFLGPARAAPDHHPESSFQKDRAQGIAMKLNVIVPCPHLISAKYQGRRNQWRYDFEDATGHSAREYLETTPNRMDVSISKCIMLAKELRPAWWVRLDADVWPLTDLLDAFAFAVENWETHGAITAVPTVDRWGQAQWKTLNDKPTPPARNGPFEVLWCSGSLVFTPMKVLDRLKPVQIVSNKDGSHIDMYIKVQDPGSTEDYDYCERVHEAGFKVLADPRIEVRQMRGEVGIPSYSGDMKIGGDVFVPLQGPGVPLEPWEKA
jgi:hypothetical protein